MKPSSSIAVLPALLPLLLFLPTSAAGDGAAGAKEGPALIRVVAVIPPGFPPTYFLDTRTGKAAGFAVDVMDAVAARAGLQVDYVFEDGWSDIIEMLRRGWGSAKSAKRTWHSRR